MMGDNDVRAWTYRCIVLVFQGICLRLACLMFIVRRPPYPLFADCHTRCLTAAVSAFDGRRTISFTTYEHCCWS